MVRESRHYFPSVTKKGDSEATSGFEIVAKNIVVILKYASMILSIMSKTSVKSLKKSDG